MKFISVNGYDNKPLFLRAHYILGVSEHKDHTEEQPLSIVTFAVIEGCEDWHIRESVESLKRKIED